MNSRDFGLLFLFVMLMLGKPGACETEAKNCTAAINVERNTGYHLKSGTSHTIKCPVTYCQKKPEIRWYRKSNNNNSLLSDGKRYKFTWMENNIFVLTFSSVHKNDSGLYHCESVSGNQTDKSHYINVTVQDDDTNTTDGHGVYKKDKTWIIYLVSSLGTLCLITVSCLSPLFFTWRYSVKNKKISSVSQSEMNVFNSHSDVKYYNDNTIPIPDEGSVLHHGAATPCLKHKHGSIICDNQVSCWKAIRALSNPVYHPSVNSTHHFPGEDQDMIVYADLSHGEHFQRSEPSAEIELTEYATIGQKN